jgi:hypothetical protein
MESLTDLLVSQLLTALDPKPVNPTREQKYLAFLICKNLSELCETGRAIINSIESKGHPITNFPQRNNIKTCQLILERYYQVAMFIEDPECGNVPNWSVVEAFPKNNADVAFKIYQAIRKNIIDRPIGKQIQDAIKRKDKNFFIQNFDKVFENIPFKDGLVKFKNLVASPYAINSEQDYIWDFFDTLLDLFLNEEENLKVLKEL